MSKSFNRSFYEDSDIQAEINVQLDILENVLDKGAIKTRINKFRLKKHMEGDTLQKAYAVNMIASDMMIVARIIIPKRSAWLNLQIGIWMCLEKSNLFERKKVQRMPRPQRSMRIWWLLMRSIWQKIFNPF